MARRPQPWLRRSRGWYVQHNGKQVFLGKDKAQAFKHFHELMSCPTRKVVKVSEGFFTVCDQFLDWTKRNRAARTYDWYIERLQPFVDYLVRVNASITVQGVKPFHVTNWLATHPNWSSTTRRSSIIAVQRCFSWAGKMGYPINSPMESLEKPPANSRDRVISPDEFKAILAKSPDQQFKDLVTSAWETGCRPQELLKIEARHIDHQNKRWILPIKEAKGKKRPRIIYLTDAAWDITKRLALKHPDGPIFRNTRGRPWTAYSVNCRFTAMKKTLDVKYCLYHFRHSFATRTLESGLDALTVALLLGHANPAMLSVTYQHMAHNPQHLGQQVRRSSISGDASTPRSA